MNFIYIIAHTVRGGAQKPPIKIGLTSKPTFRLAQIQCGNPRCVSIVSIMPHRDREIAERIEALVHKLLKKKLIRGEWYHASVAEVLEAYGVAAERVYRGVNP